MMEEGSIPWLQLLETVWRRGKLVLAVGLAGAVIVAAWVWLTPPLYRAHASIQLGAQRVTGPRTDAMADKGIESEVAMLSSPTLVKEALESLGPAPRRPAVEHTWNPFNAAYRWFHHLPAPDPLDERVRAVAQNIEANRVEETNVVEVAYRGGNPKWAANFVNTLVAKHIERIARLSEQTDTRHFYQGQRDVVYRRLEAARDALNRFRERQGSDLAPGDDAELHKAMAELDTERATADSQLAEAQARVGYLSKEIGRHPAKITSEAEVHADDSVRTLEARLTQLEVQRSEMLTKYTPTSTMVTGVDAQIAEVRKLLKGQVTEKASTKTAVNPTFQTVEVELVQRQAEQAALNARVRALAAAQGKVRAQIDRLANLSPELERLQNDEKSANEAYLDYLRKSEEARLGRALDQSGLVNINLLEPAEVPDSPEPSKSLLKLLSGIGASFALGIALALLVERLDPKVNSAAQAERITGVPVIESLSG